jgi:multiple sugar transport system substrate-binding protein
MIRVLVSLIVASSLLLSSCSGPAGKKQGAQGYAPVGHALSYDPNLPVNGGRPITITFWTQVNQEKVYRSLIEQYRRFHPNVTIELVPAAYRDHFQRLRAALESGIGPDLFHLHNEFALSLVPYMAPYPPKEFPPEALSRDFLQVQSHVIGGDIYFIDTGLMTSCVYYNKRMWREAGLGEGDVPKTWEQLRLLAKKLTVYDAGGKILRSGFNPNGIGSELFTALDIQQGQRLFSEADSRKPVLSTRAAEKSMRFIRDLYARDRVADKAMNEFHESFGAQDAAMIYAWGWAKSWLHDNYPKLEYGVFPLPSWDGSTPTAYDRNNGECSMGVNKASSEEKKAVAFDLIRYYLSEDRYLLDLCLEFNVSPSKISLGANPRVTGDASLSAAQKILERTVWPGQLPAFYFRTLTDELVDPVVIDGADIGASLQKAQLSLTKLFEDGPFHSLEDAYKYSGAPAAPRDGSVPIIAE